jgi:integrase
LGADALVELEPLRLQELYARLLLPVATGGAGLSAGSVRNLHLVLGQAFGQAVRWRLITSSPAVGAQPPWAQRPHRVVVDPPLLRRVLNAAAGDRLEAAVALAAATGMRRGEILALTWADVNEEMSLLQVRRTL